MGKSIFLSFVGHVVFFALFLLLFYMQAHFARLTPINVIRVQFYNLPPSPAMTPRVQPTPVKPQLTPAPKPPVKTPPQKEFVKPEPKPIPKKTAVKPEPKEEPQPKEKPKLPPKELKSTPVPQRTPWPPLPTQPSTPAQPSKQPSAQPPIPIVPQGPLKVTQALLPNYYLLMAQQKIEGNFKLARSQRYAGLFCVVEFRVNREGQISDIRVVRSTGQSSLDRFASEALELTVSLAPLPDSIREPSITIMANFDYSP
jgi:protein TonB